jgi:hypothetical protein
LIPVGVPVDGEVIVRVDSILADVLVDGMVDVHAQHADLTLADVPSEVDVVQERQFVLHVDLIRADVVQM